MSHPVVAVSHAQEMIEEFLPHLRAAQQRGPAAWVTGVLAADSGLEQAVLVALAREGLAVEAARTRLREVLSDGADRAALCAASLEVEGCFALLLGWELSWWTGETLPLAIDASDLREHEVVLSLSGLYRNSAIPVAWVVLPHLGKGAWLPHLERLLGRLGPTLPAGMRVLVMTDRGLWSPTRWRAILTQGGPPVMRIRPVAAFAPAGWRRQRAHESVSGPGCCWVGEGVAYKERATQLACTLLVVWGAGQKEPWRPLTDLSPEDVDGSWYGLRVWIELGFGGAEVLRLGLAAHAADPPVAHRAALAGARHRHPAQSGRGHAVGGSGGAGRAAWPLAASPHPTSRPAPPPQGLRPGAGRAAPTGAARRAVVGLVAAAGAVAHPGPRDHPDASWSPSRGRITRLPPSLSTHGEKGASPECGERVLN